MMYYTFMVSKYNYIWTYNVLLMYVFTHYWNKYVIIMHDIDKIEINIIHK